MFLSIRIDNPVFVKDVRTRMRGTRPFTIMLANTGLLLLVAAIWWTDRNWRTRPDLFASPPGRDLLQILIAVQAILITFLAPAISSGAFTLEREQQSLSMLILSSMPPLQIVWGRICSVALFLILIITSSVPFVAICFMLGGLSPGELVLQYVSLAIAALILSALGVLCSTSSSRTHFAIPKAYGTTIILSVALLLPGEPYFRAMYASPSPGPSPVTLLDFYGGSLHATEGAPFFLRTIPAWICGVPIGIAIIALFTLVAANLFPGYEGLQSSRIRILTLALYLFGFFTLEGWIMGTIGKAILGAGNAHMGDQSEPFLLAHRLVINLLIGSGWLLIAIGAPLICSKSIRRESDSLLTVLLGAMDPRNIFRGRLRSSVPFVFFSSALTVPLGWFAFAWIGADFWKEGVAHLLRSLLYGYLVLAFVLLICIAACLLFRPARAAGIAIAYFVMIAASIVPIVPPVASDWGYSGHGPYWKPSPSSGFVVISNVNDLIVLSPFAVGLANAIKETGPQYFPEYGPRVNIPLNRWSSQGAIIYACLDLILIVLILVLFSLQRASPPVGKT